MTISSTNRKAGPYAGNDVAVAFPFAFKVFAASDLYVVRADSDGAETVLALTANYTVTLNADQNANPGGTITLPAALADGLTLTITSTLPYLQPVDLTNNGGFYPKVINSALDRLTIFVQQIASAIGASLKLGSNDTPGSGAYRAGGNRIADVGNPTSPGDAVNRGWLDLAITGVNTYANSLYSQARSYAESLVSGVVGGYGYFIQLAAGAISRTFQDKMRESVSVLDFFANGVSGPAVDPTGVIDSTLGIQAAIDSIATTGGSVNFSAGVFLISSSLQVSTYGISLVGVNGAALWNGLSTINTGGTIIKKSSTMTTDAVILVGGRSDVCDLAIDGLSGNSGDGIYIKDSQSTSINNVCVSRMGGSGIRIGTKPGSNGNVNGWQLNNVTCQKNLTHGVLIQDESTDVLSNGPNANAGTAVGLNTAGNSGEGLRIVNGQFNTFVGLLSQQNYGYGVALVGTAALSLYETFIGGDVEANVTGNWYVSPDAKHILCVGSFTTLPTLSPDNFGAVYSSTFCKTRSIRFSDSDSQLDVYKEGQFTPTVSGSIASGFNTYVWQSGYYTRIGNTVKVEGVVRLTGKGVGGNAMTGNVLISGLPYTGKNSTLARCLFNVSTDGGITPTAGYNTALVGRVDENQSSITLLKLNNTDCSLYPVVISDIQDSFIVYFSGTYLV